MTHNQLAILQCMCNGLFQPTRYDLSRDDMNAVAAAIDGMPNPRLVKALHAVLLFYDPGPWDSHKQLAWHNLTGLEGATTKGLCDFIRGVLEQPFGEHTERLVQDIVRMHAGGDA